MQAAETKSYFSMNKKTAYLFLINVRKNRQYNKMQSVTKAQAPSVTLTLTY